MVGFLFTDEVELDAAAAAKVLTDEGRDLLAEAAKRLQEVEPWTADDIEGTFAASRPSAASSPRRPPAGPPGHHRPAGQPAAVRVHGAARQAPLPGPPGAGRRGARLSDPPGGR